MFYPENISLYLDALQNSVRYLGSEIHWAFRGGRYIRGLAANTERPMQYNISNVISRKFGLDSY